MCSCFGRFKRKPLGMLKDALVHQTVHAFTMIEHLPATPDTLPEWVPDTQGNALRLSVPPMNNCNTYKTHLNPDGSTTVTRSYACSSPWDSSTLSGEVAWRFTRGTDVYQMEYRALRLVVGTTSWTINGTKHIQLHRTARHATITTPTPMTVAIMDSKTPSNSQSFSYGCKIISDYQSPDVCLLWGWFSLQAGADPILKGNIAPGEALQWFCKPLCGHPGPGRIKLSQGSNSSEPYFQSPGIYIFSGENKARQYHLPACFR